MSTSIFNYTPYRGRFAPSPSGPLHYGSLVTAVASYLQARRQHGQWLVRIEDIDPAREVKGAATSILQTLKDYGFIWRQRPLLQSRRIAFHRQLCLGLIEKNQAYACSCSRKDIARDAADSGSMGPIYAGRCADKNLNYTENSVIRMRVENSCIEFTDAHFGKQYCNLKKASGDFVIFRADQLPSYILAVSVDDLYQGYTQIVRGADLLALTPRQIYLHQIFKKDSPGFMHIPIISHPNGDKLSKQTHAPALKKQHARAWLYNVLSDLGQEPPRRLRWQSLAAIWQWAIDHWQPQNIPRSHFIVMRH